MKIFTTSIFSALLALSVVPLASAAPFQGHLQPKNDTRCLARVSGGFSLEACSSTNSVSFQNPGSISFGNECVFVQISDVQETDPWKSGTRLMARQCSDSTIPTSNKTWTYDSASQQIRTSPPNSNVAKCLSIEGLVGSLRAVVKDCDESGVTTWTLSP